VSTVGLHFEDEAERVISVCKGDIVALWNDKVVQRLLKERKVRLELEGGFFLDDLDRVCALDYVPNDCKCVSPFWYPVPSHYGTFFFLQARYADPWSGGLLSPQWTYAKRGSRLWESPRLIFA
jgi:hypothetical protein